MKLLENLSDAGKLKIKLGVIMLSAVLLIWVLTRGCGGEKVQIPDSQPIVDSFNTRIKKYEEQLKNDSTAYYKELYNAQLKRVSDTEKKLSGEKKKVLSLTAQVILSRKETDTSEHSIKCDSLAASIPPLIERIEDYRDERDSLHLAHLKERESADARLEAQQKLISELRMSFLDMKGLKEESDKKIVSLNKKVKKEKGISKLAAAIGIIAIGALVAK
jgi:hypothetical protein